MTAMRSSHIDGRLDAVSVQQGLCGRSSTFRWQREGARVSRRRNTSLIAIVIITMSSVGCRGIGHSLSVGAADGLASRRDTIANAGAHLLSEFSRVVRDSLFQQFDNTVDGTLLPDSTARLIESLTRWR